MSQIEPVIYLDLDGVCADYVSAAIRTCGYQPEEIFELWKQEHQGDYRIHKVLGINRQTYWDTQSQAGESFWSGLESYHWFDDLYKSLGEIATVIFLSSASRAPECLSGKLKWLQARFGASFREYIFTGHKQQLAHRAAILVDDYDRNINKFRQAGGSGVLFPQIWNSNYPINDRLEFTLGQVKEWYERIVKDEEVAG